MIPAAYRADADAALLVERAARIRGDEVAYKVIVSEDPSVQGFFTDPQSMEWFLTMQKTKAPAWENRYTVHSLFDALSYNPTGFVEALCPTPWLLIQGDTDHQCPPDLNMQLFANAPEPKESMMFEGGHFTPFAGTVFEETMAAEIDFLKRKLYL